MKFQIMLLLFLLLVGCTNKDHSVLEAEKLLKEAEELLDEVDKQDFSQDYNFDGIPDVYFEYYRLSYAQFIDRNFDGKPDERYEYDSATDFILDGRLDNDFDGIFETQVVISQGIVQFEFIDSDNDNMIDIVRSFKDGVLKGLEKHIQNGQSKSNSLEVYVFEFGVPIFKEISTTKISRIEFHENQVSKIKTQNMQSN